MFDVNAEALSLLLWQNRNGEAFAGPALALCLRVDKLTRARLNMHTYISQLLLEIPVIQGPP